MTRNSRVSPAPEDALGKRAETLSALHEDHSNNPTIKRADYKCVCKRGLTVCNCIVRSKYFATALYFEKYFAKYFEKYFATALSCMLNLHTLNPEAQQLISRKQQADQLASYRSTTSQPSQGQYLVEVRKHGFSSPSTHIKTPLLFRKCRSSQMQELTVQTSGLGTKNITNTHQRINAPLSTHSHLGEGRSCKNCDCPIPIHQRTQAPLSTYSRLGKGKSCKNQL